VPFIRLINGDASLLSSWAPDLVLTDPPYGVTGYKWDRAPDLDGFLDTAFRSCSGAVVVFGVQPFTSRVVQAMGRHFRYTWVWEKGKATGHLQARIRPMRAHEEISVGYQGAVYNPQMTVGEPYKGTPRGISANDGIYARYGAHREDNPGVRYPRSVLRFPARQRGRIHGTQKPIALLRYLIRTYSDPGDLVADPFAGSGSTAVAAYLEGRSFIGTELDQEIYGRASEWIVSVMRGEDPGT